MGLKVAAGAPLQASFGVLGFGEMISSILSERIPDSVCEDVQENRTASL